MVSGTSAESPYVYTVRLAHVEQHASPTRYGEAGRPEGDDGQRPGNGHIPADIHRQLDIGPRDKLRWDVDEDGNLTVAVIRQREGVFDDFEPVDVGETNAVEAEREFGAE
jgi:antitoxin PrlF